MALSPLPKSEAELLTLVGQLERAKRRAELAEALGALVSAVPANATYAKRLGWLWLDLKKPEAARGIFEPMAGNPGPDRWEATGAMASVLAAEGKPEEALALFRKAFDRGVRLSGMLTTLLQLLNKAGRHDMGLEAIEEWVKESPADPALLFLLARQLSSLGRLPEALAEMRKVMTSAASFPGQAELFVETLAGAGCYEEAVDAACTLLAQSFENPQLHNLLAHCLQYGFSESAAKARLEARVRKNGSDAPALYHLAMTHLRLGAWEEAAQVIDACRSLQPNSTLAADIVARCAVLRGDYHEARKIYNAIWDASARAWPTFPEKANPAGGSAVRPVIYLTIEIVGREFLTRLLIAHHAIASGFTCVILSHTAIKSHLRSLPPGIILHKGLNSLDVDFFEDAVRAGHAVATIDEEAFGWTGDVRSMMCGVDPRALPFCEAVFAAGREYAEKAAARLPAMREKFVVTGNPRTDIFSERFSGLFAAEAQTVREAYGPFILLCTNVGCWNSSVLSYSNGCQLVLMAGGASRDSDMGRWTFAMAKNSMVCELENMAGLRMAIPALASGFPSRKIVIRPHPTEDYSTWRHIVGNLPNVVVDGTSSLGPQILASDAVVHLPGCGTGLEALLLERVAISFDALGDHEHAKIGLSWHTSQRVMTTAAMIEALRQAIRGDGPARLSAEQKRLFDYCVERGETPAAARIAEELTNIFLKRSKHPVAAEAGSRAELHRELRDALAGISARMTLNDVKFSRAARLKRVTVSAQNIEDTLATMAQHLGTAAATTISVDRVADGYFILN